MHPLFDRHHIHDVVAVTPAAQGRSGVHDLPEAHGTKTFRETIVGRRRRHVTDEVHVVRRAYPDGGGVRYQQLGHLAANEHHLLTQWPQRPGDTHERGPVG
jgi:hypothetical protein